MNQHDRYGIKRRSYPQATALGGNFAEWSVPWSDLMMIMFIVFAVLFIYSVKNGRDKPVPAAAPPRENAVKAPEDPMQAFLGQLEAPVDRAGKARVRDLGGGRETYYQSDNLGVSVVRETDRQVRVFLRGDLFFSPGGDHLAGNSGPYLERIAEILKVSTGAVLVVGHAAQGETSAPEESLALSARRASSVAEYFIRTAGLDPKRFLVTGRGEYQPEVPETDKDAQTRNRRVEVLVLTDI